MTRTCANCRYWQNSSVTCGLPLTAPPLHEGARERTVGSCHIRAPSAFFPNTMDDDWCGEFEDKRYALPSDRPEAPASVL